MKRYSCPSCAQEIFFHNTVCLNCGAALVFRPGTGFAVLEPAGPIAHCANREAIACNWAAQENGGLLCFSCAHTTVVPDLSVPGNPAKWERIETAKRPLMLMLLRLGLPLADAQGSPVPRFELKGDPLVPGAPRVLTGHENGTITLNIGEADDAAREAVRNAMGEPYRTLTGHFRHEVAHHFWDEMTAADPARLAQLRAVFGDETRDYASALQAHYAQGAPADWERHFISAYASSHPWEDFAETWAHLFHVLDGLETAQAFGLLQGADLPEGLEALADTPFDRLAPAWINLSVALNALNQAMGYESFYPFVLSPEVVTKLETIRQIIADVRQRGA